MRCERYFNKRCCAYVGIAFVLFGALGFLCATGASWWANHTGQNADMSGVDTTNLLHGLLGSSAGVLASSVVWYKSCHANEKANDKITKTLIATFVLFILSGIAFAITFTGKWGHTWNANGCWGVVAVLGGCGIMPLLYIMFMSSLPPKTVTPEPVTDAVDPRWRLHVDNVVAGDAPTAAAGDTDGLKNPKCRSRVDSDGLEDAPVATEEIGTSQHTRPSRANSGASWTAAAGGEPEESYTAPGASNENSELDTSAAGSADFREPDFTELLDQEYTQTRSTIASSEESVAGGGGVTQQQQPAAPEPAAQQLQDQWYHTAGKAESADGSVAGGGGVTQQQQPAAPEPAGTKTVTATRTAPGRSRYADWMSGKAGGGDRKRRQSDSNVSTATVPTEDLRRRLASPMRRLMEEINAAA